MRKLERGLTPENTTSKASKPPKKQGNPNTPYVLQNRKEKLEASAIERLKVLDSDFGAALQEVEQAWITEANKHLSKLLDDAMTVNAYMMNLLTTNSGEVVVVATGEKIRLPLLSVEDMARILTGQRQLIKELSEQFRLDQGKPTSISGHLHAHKTLGNISDEELDAKIAEHTRHLSILSRHEAIEIPDSYEMTKSNSNLTEDEDDE